MSQDPLEKTRRVWWVVAGVVGVALVVAIILFRPVGGAASGPVTPSESTTTVPGVTPVPTESLPAPTATGKPTVVPTASVSTINTDLSATAEPAPGVTAKLTAIESVTGVARGPGEVAGPALRVTVEISNGTGEALDTSLGLVNLYYGEDRTPASTLSGPGVRPFPSQIEPGGKGSATTVFNVPLNARGETVIEFSYRTDRPVVVFSGAV